MKSLYRLLPVVAFVATFGFFFVDKNREARTVLRSGRGLLVVALIVIGYVVLGWVVKRVVRWKPAASLLMTASLLGLASWTVLPYYRDTTVNRTVVAGPIATVPTTTTPLGGTSATVPSEVGDTSGSTAPTATTTTTATTAPAPVATRVSSGEIRGIDHEARGTASLIRTADGGLVVRLENFAIEGAPDPVLYLAEGDDVRSRSGVKLGRLPGNRGDLLDVRVPDGMAAGAGPGWTVLIWCERFAVPIANATQR